jgi:hypothetical protein
MNAVETSIFMRRRCTPSIRVRYYFLKPGIIRTRQSCGKCKTFSFDDSVAEGASSSSHVLCRKHIRTLNGRVCEMNSLGDPIHARASIPSLSPPKSVTCRELSELTNCHFSLVLLKILKAGHNAIGEDRQQAFGCRRGLLANENP